MNCEHARKLLDACYDGEVDAGSAAAVRVHLNACPSCAARYHEREVLSRELGKLPRPVAPAALRAAVGELVLASPRISRSGLRPALTLRWWQALGMATCLALIAFGLGWWTGQAPGGVELDDEIVSLHAAALKQGAAAERSMATSDRHQVKPWLAARVDFAPPVPDLQALGFMLQGARIEQLGSQPAAVISYRVRNHAISLFVWRGDAAGVAAPGPQRWRGYAAVTWAAGGLVHAAISDVDAQDLLRFAAAVGAPVQSGPPN